MKAILRLCVALSAMTIALSATAKVDVGETAPAFTLPGADGADHSLSQYAGKWVVLEWVNYGCPFVKKFYDKSDKMAELQKEWTGKDVVWLSICSSAPGNQGYYDAAEVQKTNDQKGWAGSAYLVDASGKVGKEYGATNTPQMYVINPEGKIVYMGAIDSKKSANPDDIKSADNYVDLALSAAMEGKEITTPKSKPYGCGVKY
ncbi:thioredoxin family protein [Cerasicoccus arenae]|uniref:Thioredoxin family protein n=1 Tax=Cerasicoccus arenae TaxID=424488 RepID=A0A8J3GCE6_9BACT|nr:thioredoxin family protein [Cerasicoccus arenae]MBK1859127.1 thioredoxin family protein [Cerasicoccus arenae]GHB97996.1 thioredoxin family protein [Cerasicoccus arenae]